LVDLHLTLDGRRDLAGQIYRGVRAAILDGRLRPGDALPPTRELAARLEVSRSTATTAYERLLAEGFVEGRVGAGTFVSAAAAPTATPARATSLRARAIWDELPLLPGREPAAYDFRVGLPDGRLFPHAVWRRLLAKETRPPPHRAAPYGDPGGEASLRAAIARSVAVSRNVRARGEDIVVTAGAQQALDLIAKILVEPGARVAVEDPGYTMARNAFRAHGARVVPVPVDAEGLRVDRLPADARVVYVTPSHQLPLGMPMSLPRRLALLDWAARRRVAVIEDDYDSELRFGGRPLDPLHALDRHGVVLYVASFSKVLLPALRLGYVVAPPGLATALQTARQLADFGGPIATERALARFLDDGLLGRHVRNARREYEARRDRLLAAIARELGDRVEVVPTAAGLHLTAFLRDDLDDHAVVSRARELDVALSPLSRFYAARPKRGLVIGFGAVAYAKIDEGVRRIATATAAAARPTRTRSMRPRRPRGA
jgi:GntR family transcriptional regulator/MocR family aminotransferase